MVWKVRGNSDIDQEESFMGPLDRWNSSKSQFVDKQDNKTSLLLVTAKLSMTARPKTVQGVPQGSPTGHQTLCE